MKEIFLPHGTTGLTTLYAAVRRPSDGFWWYTVTPAFEAFNAGHVAAGYAVALTEQGTTGNYYADFPAGITAAGRYEVTARKQAGGSPAWPADAVVGTQSDFDWSGSAVVVPYAGADTAGTTSLLALAGGGSGFAAIKGDTAAIKARTDALPTAPADETLVIGATNAIMARLGAPAAGSIAADIATRSTYAGGTVAGVTAPVTVGANNDKTGYSLNLAQTGLSPRALDSVADGALTVGDGLVAAICAAAGKETVVGTAYTVKTPSTGTVIRTFALDNASTPTTRS